MLPIVILTIENDDDREFMSQLYLEYQHLMYSEISKLVSDVWIVEDIIQDSLVRLIDKIALLRELNQRRRINYVITTVRNATKNYYRTKSRRPVESIDDEDSAFFQKISTEENIEEIIILKDNMERLRTVWPQLTDTTRQLLERKYILNQNDAEIAEAFGVKTGSIRMKLTRARKEVLGLIE